MKHRPSIWEWVGVTVIVLFVAAVLFPIFAKSHGGGHHGSCMSNEKQLGLGLLQYVDNYDELMPPVTHDQKNTWRIAAYNYIKSDGVYKCPDDERTTPGPDGHFQSYAFNAGSVVNSWGAKPQSPQTAPEYETLVLLCEIQNTDHAAFDIDDPVRFSPDKHILAVRHSGGGNYLLADGHAKWFRPSAFTASPPAPGTLGTTIPRWYRAPRRALSANARAVLVDAQARAQ